MSDKQRTCVSKNATSALPPNLLQNLVCVLPGWVGIEFDRLVPPFHLKVGASKALALALTPGNPLSPAEHGRPASPAAVSFAPLPLVVPRP
jgi:hypothetical protein